MALRPRYSLLTLFLLTAAVAGGIKLWRGPHEVQVNDDNQYASNPAKIPSPSDAKLLELMPVRPAVCGGANARHRYLYKNSLDGREVILVAGYPTHTHDLCYPKNAAAETRSFAFIYRMEGQHVVTDDWQAEELHGWVQGEPDKIPQDKRWNSMIHGYLQVFLAPRRQFERERSHLYLLTKKRQVFQVERKNLLSLELLPVEVEAIPNPDVRAWITQEFAGL